MRRLSFILTFCLLLLICASACQNAARNTSYPNDPLLVAYTPIEVKTAVPAPVQLASTEPTVPPIPEAIRATAERYVGGTDGNCPKSGSGETIRSVSGSR